MYKKVQILTVPLDKGLNQEALELKVISLQKSAFLIWSSFGILGGTVRALQDA